MLTIRRTVADGVRMFTGFATPSRIGPSVTPPPEETLSRLNEMFAASTVGITSRFASPLRREFGNAPMRTSSESAASPCISPSISRSGSCAFTSASARRIFAADGWSLVPKLECESSATFGTMPNRRISSAASRVISAISSAVGSAFT